VKAVRVAVLLNPANASVTESTLRIVQEIAPTIGLQIQILNATTIGEIDAAFATLERERPEALFVAGDAFFVSRVVQFATLTARGRIPATYSLRDYVAAGGLMSYGTLRVAFRGRSPLCQWRKSVVRQIQTSFSAVRSPPS